MPQYVRVCMSDQTFLSVDLDQARKFPSPRRWANLPDGSRALNAEAFRVKAEIERNLAGRRTAPEWFLGCSPVLGAILYWDEVADVWFIAAFKSLMPSGLKDIAYFELERDEATRWLGGHGYRIPRETGEALPELVTLDQAAGMVHRKKRTLERYKASGKLPDPACKGRGGRFDLWDWRTLHPYLEREFGMNLPSRFPASRSR